jgi:hypothetical protein
VGAPQPVALVDLFGRCGKSKLLVVLAESEEHVDAVK